jgi:hypothetical protein
VRPDASLAWLADQTGGVYLEDGMARRHIQSRADPFGYVREIMNNARPTRRVAHARDHAAAPTASRQLRRP